jgi:replicative superfamily II helicase
VLGAAVHAYPGQHQLARLLLSAGDRLVTDAVINVPVPPGVDASTWRAFLTDLAAKRPFLWSNHLQAVREGYLHPGTSSVVSFPTGAGKSTLSELKIAATLLSGRRVIFLAPTRALVWQTVQALRRSFPGRSIEESLTGDGAYHEADLFAELPDVVVMTPEKCLMYLGSRPESLAGTGLLVFDECHLLHPERADASDRRSLDAMLCLLGMLDVARGCDILLLSAMVKNAEELANWIASVTERPLHLAGRRVEADPPGAWVPRVRCGGG